MLQNHTPGLLLREYPFVFAQFGDPNLETKHLELDLLQLLKQKHPQIQNCHSVIGDLYYNVQLPESSKGC